MSSNIGAEMVRSVFKQRIFDGELSRRDFLRLTAGGGAALAASSALSGCAIDPVTGKRSLVGLSTAQEREIDKQYAPHQFSNDYGAVQDDELNTYLRNVGTQMAANTHRPDMPYDFTSLNATYVNAYTFPAGSVGITRGILLEMDSEDELAGLVGHELGHVNARHAAEQAGRSMVAQLAVIGATIAAANSSDYSDMTRYIQLGGSIGASALLAKYSRDNEREADQLGMQYMAQSGHNPQGMVQLMEMLTEKSKYTPDLIETMFSSHPLSTERYATAKQRVDTEYGSEAGRQLRRERYMDNTASLRAIGPAIKQLQAGSEKMSKEKFAEAEPEFASALSQAPEDYAGLVMMSKCQMAQKKHEDAQQYLERAKAAYPEEAQALHASGVNKMALKQYDAALAEFTAFEEKLPGNADTTFLKGVAQESMQNPREAAQEYARYLQQVRSGSSAQHAYQRLNEWGYVRRRRGSLIAP